MAIPLRVHAQLPNRPSTLRMVGWADDTMTAEAVAAKFRLSMLTGRVQKHRKLGLIWRLVVTTFAQIPGTVYRTTRDAEVTAWENQGAGAVWRGIIPAGTRVVRVPNGTGEDLWGVDDVPLLIRLTGNTHDPHYRYVIVPTDTVEASAC